MLKDNPKSALQTKPPPRENEADFALAIEQEKTPLLTSSASTQPNSWLAKTLYYLIAPIMSISYALFQQFYNMFCMLYFIGAKQCQLENKGSRHMIFSICIAAAISLPGSVIQLSRFYRTLCYFFGRPENNKQIEHSKVELVNSCNRGPIRKEDDQAQTWSEYFSTKISSYYKWGSFGLELGLMGLSGSNVVAAFVDTTTKSDLPCDINITTNGWVYKSVAGVFMIFCSINHKLVIYGVRKKPVIMSNIAAATAWAIASLVGQVFAASVHLIEKHKKDEPLNTTDILHLVILSLSICVLLPYKTYSNVQEYKTYQGTPLKATTGPRCLTCANSCSCFVPVITLLRKYGLSSLVSGLTWYNSITGMIVIFQLFGLLSTGIIAAISTAGGLASLGYLFRFFYYVNADKPQLGNEKQPLHDASSI